MALLIDADLLVDLEQCDADNDPVAVEDNGADPYSLKTHRRQNALVTRMGTTSGSQDLDNPAA